MSETEHKDHIIPYKWTQTLAEATLSIPVPAGTRARDVNCKITATHLTVGLKGQPPLIDGEVHKKIKPIESFWQMDEGNTIFIELQKVNKMEWWTCIIKGHPEIDTTKIEPENSKLSDLDDETRNIVEKMMFEQRQKAAGATSDEQQKKAALENFMKSHPEMDFSNAKIG